MRLGMRLLSMMFWSCCIAQLFNSQLTIAEHFFVQARHVDYIRPDVSWRRGMSSNVLVAGALRILRTALLAFGRFAQLVAAAACWHRVVVQGW
jgi:hypothetical protein